MLPSRIGLGNLKRLPRSCKNTPVTINMHTQTGLDSSPPMHRGMNVLDKSAFRKSFPVLAAQVPAVKAGSVLKAEAMRRSIMNLPKVRTVVANPADPNGDRLVLLRVSEKAELAPEALQYLEAESNGFSSYTLDLDYDFWTADEILQSILPEELCERAPTGFAITGHLAHLNLNDEFLPYKHIIGQVILDKNKKIKTVVNKLYSIDTQFRFFKMELIAGEADYVVEHHESDCRFTFDFTQVYWNSRLHTEHDRLVQLFQPEDVIADVFAGVGPFAIPAAKRGCAVFANDLNPNSAKYLSHNVADNKVSDLVRVSCEDGRDFIRAVTARLLDSPFSAYKGPRLSRLEEKKRRRELQEAASQSQAPDVGASPASPRNRVSHFVMNLPDSAITFLDAFRGILAERNMSGIYDVMPMIHCHCFTRELEPDKAEADIRQRVEEKIGHALDEDVSLHFVRSVAPNKDMYCMSFRLPRVVAFAQ